MNKLNNAKTFGGIGALLSLIGGFIPLVGPVVALLGLILLFVAVKYIADVTKDQPIFKHYLMSFILTVIAIIATAAMMFVALGGFSLLAAFQNMNITNPTAVWGTLGISIGIVIAALVVGWILLVLGAYYLRKSYNRIAKQTNVDMFRTTGKIYFIGAITLIIVIGALILLVAKILEIVAYFSLPDKLPKTTKKTEETS